MRTAAGQGPWPAGHGRHPGARRGRMCRRHRRLAAAPGLSGRRSAVILVDDQSRDGTAQVARDAAAALGAADRLTVLSGRALPAGWTGKLWAQSQGVEAAEAAPQPPDYLLFTDADIVYAPDELRKLVARARIGRLRAHLADGEASLRELCRAHVRSRPSSSSSRCSIPFAWANDPRPRHRGGGRRLHAGAPRSACALPAAWPRSATP